MYRAALALVNSLGALGSFAGTYIVGYLNGVTGTSGASFSFMAGALIGAVILTMFVKGEKKEKSQPTKKIFNSSKSNS
jgi:uncharacterized membrane protein YeaQ/YmgE (transglycosylase-associated protein family)